MRTNTQPKNVWYWYEAEDGSRPSQPVTRSAIERFKKERSSKGKITLAPAPQKTTTKVDAARHKKVPPHKAITLFELASKALQKEKERKAAEQKAKELAIKEEQQEKNKKRLEQVLLYTRTILTIMKQ